MGSSGGWSGRRWGAALASGVLACASAVVAVGSVQSGVSALGVPSPSCPGARFAASVAAFSPADGLFDAGSNGAGQLGNGSTAPTAMFQQISLAPPPSVGTATVVAGTDFALATDAGSTLYAWGDNTDGQLGNGTPASSSVPVPVRMPQGVTAQSLAAGGNFSLAIGSDSNLYAWGDNSTGQLGNASPTGSNVPVQVPLAPGVTPSSIAAGPDFALMIDTSGAVWAWGANGAGQLGLGSTSASVTQPTRVPLPQGVTAYAVAAGAGFALMIGSDGNLYAWGANAHGQLGDASTAPAPSAVKVLLPSGVTPINISAGADFALATGSDGNLYAWGDGADGQLGNGTTSPVTSRPVVTLLPQGVTARAISAGSDFAMALGSDCSLYAWGNNTHGQLALGDHSARSTPTAVSLGQALTPTFLPQDNLGTSSYVLVRPQAPVITDSSATFLAGHPASVQIPVVASPLPTFGETGPLPPGITLSSAGLLSGTPQRGSGGVYRVQVTAGNGLPPNAVVPFTITVDEAPTLTPTPPITLAVGHRFRLKLKATGTPAPVFAEFGRLPKGVHLRAAGVLVGRPRPKAVGSYTVGIVAANGVAPDALEGLTLTVVRK